MGLRKRIEKVLTGRVPGGIPILKMRIINKTGDYTVKPGESGSLFSTRGASGSVNFTLPALEDGLFYWFFNGALATVMQVTGANNNELIAFNDVDADNVKYQTGNERAGGGFLLVCDGTLWHAFAFAYGLGATAQTVTVTT